MVLKLYTGFLCSSVMGCLRVGMKQKSLCVRRTHGKDGSVCNE